MSTCVAAHGKGPTVGICGSTFAIWVVNGTSSDDIKSAHVFQGSKSDAEKVDAAHPQWV
jgi:hypothetical protein